MATPTLKRDDPTRADFEAFYLQEDPWASRSCIFEVDRIAKFNEVFKHCRFARGLDIGCGEGDLLQSLDFIEHKVGVDISENALSRARNRYPDIDFRQGDVSRAETLPRGPFDFISCLECLYYLSSNERRDQAVRAIADLGQPNCVFLFSLVVLGENEHRRYFTLESALRMLSSHLNVLYYFPTRLNLPTRLGQLRYRMLPQPRRLAFLSSRPADRAYQCAFVCVRHSPTGH